MRELDDMLICVFLKFAERPTFVIYVYSTQVVTLSVNLTLPFRFHMICQLSPPKFYIYYMNKDVNLSSTSTACPLPIMIKLLSYCIVSTILNNVYKIYVLSSPVTSGMLESSLKVGSVR